MARLRLGSALTPKATSQKAHSPWHARSPWWAEVALVSPVFVLYHVGVIFLPLRNAADWVTRELIELAAHQRGMYLLLTCGLAAGYCLALLLIGLRPKLGVKELCLLAAESAVYATAMRGLAGAVVGQLGLAKGQIGPAEWSGMAGGFVMSLGAGLYEELAFRALMFGAMGSLLARAVAHSSPWSKLLFWTVWAAVVSAVFSAWHHLGELGESFTLQAFVFRLVCGLWFCLLYAWRGFAVAVWTHFLYDAWLLVP